jgi:NAD(P)-dependent dehydrogenase (short-subunit alcohol dehydrogenase family)
MGASVVRLSSEMGAEVHVLDLKEPPVAVASSHLVDLKDPDAIAAALDAVEGPVDALFNCAGIGGAADVDVVIVNFLAQRHAAELLAPRMPEGSAICGLASVAGNQWAQRVEQWLPLVATPTFAEGRAWIEAHPEEINTGYAPSKEALIVWSKWAAVDFARRGIRINVLSPGTTDTPMTAMMDDVPGASYMADLFTQGLGRRATADEQAWIMLFLNSPLASYVNAENLIADGGTMAGVVTGRIELDFDPEHLGAKDE